MKKYLISILSIIFVCIIVLIGSVAFSGPIQQRHLALLARLSAVGDLSITYGAINEFEAANTLYESVAMLDSTHFVIAYSDVGDSGHGKAVIGLVSGTTISSYGAINTFNTADTWSISVAALDSTHFVVVYRDQGNSGHGYAIVGEVSGTTISSYGAANEFHDGVIVDDGLFVAALDSTHFVVAYREFSVSNHGYAIIGLTSGTSISSYGAANKFEAASVSFISVAALDSTHFVVAYQDVGGSSWGTAIVGLVSGTTISSYGAALVFEVSTTTNISVAVLDSAHFIVVFNESAFNGIGRVGLVSGTTISSYGVQNIFNAGNTSWISAAAFSANTFVVGYRDASAADQGRARIGLVSGTTISSYGTEAEFEPGTTSYTSVAALDSTHFVVGYRDSGDSGYGKAIVGEGDI